MKSTATRLCTEASRVLAPTASRLMSRVDEGHRHVCSLIAGTPALCLKFGRTFGRCGDQSHVGRGAGAHCCPLCAASPASEEAAPELLGLTQQRQQVAQHPAQQRLHEFCIQTVMSGLAVAGTLVLAPSRDIPPGSTELQFLQQSLLQPIPRKGTIKVNQPWFMIFLFPVQFTTWPHKLLSCRTGGRSNQPGGKLFKQPLQLLPTES